MVDMKTETKPQNEEKRPETGRDATRAARARRLKLIAGDRPKTIKVFPANETMRAVLRHGNGTRFRDGIESAEWPNDSFTARRIADGSVLTESAGSSEEAPEADASLNAREQAVARRPKPKEAKPEASKEKNGNGNGKPQPQPPQPQPPAA